MSNVLISCGGTGGHLAPGIAVAQGLIERGHRCCLVVSRKEVDSRLLKKYPELDYVRAPGTPFSWHPVRFVRFFISQVIGILFAIRMINKQQPDVIFGFGGFITVGVSLAGFLLNCPIVLHEANRRPGKAVRMLASIAQRIYLPEGVRLKSLMPRTIRHYGFPVRKGIRKINRDAARQALKIDIKGKLLLVLGGSQGAVSLNKWVKAHFEHLANRRINVMCITGINKGSEGVIEHRSDSGRIVRCYFRPFSDQMAEMMSAADLAVARAGAGTIAEFIRCGLPSILVPYPFAADNHQFENACFLEQQGGGIVLPQEQLAQLETEVSDMIFNDWLLDKMTRNLNTLNRHSSLDLILRDVESIADEHHDRTRFYRTSEA